MSEMSTFCGLSCGDWLDYLAWREMGSPKETMLDAKTIALCERNFEKLYEKWGN